jgi:hypothetical protein
MFNNAIEPNVSLSDWQQFRQQFLLIDRIIERNEARLPEWFLPLARGGAFPSKGLLRQIGYHRGMKRPHGWGETSNGFYRTLIDVDTRLIVRQSEDLDLWSVERWSFKRRSEVDEVLVFRFGATPIFTKDPVAAMLLARHCHLKGPPPGLSWFKGPADPEAVAKIARQRQLDEAACVTE